MPGLTWHMGQRFFVFGWIALTVWRFPHSLISCHDSPTPLLQIHHLFQFATQ